MIDGIVFDKDGTLFDFRLSWGRWTRDLLSKLADENIPAAALGAVIGYDMGTGEFAPDSPVIAATPAEIAQTLLPHLPGHNQTSLVEEMNRLAANTEMTPAVELRPLLLKLRAKGLKIGLATNDTEVPARSHLAAAGVLDLFDFVSGCDSGFGGKPSPGQLLAFAAQFDLEPRRVAMVGDSHHDLIAGRQAGMYAIAVLTGIATKADLTGHADAVLENIDGLPDWIDQLCGADP